MQLMPLTWMMMAQQLGQEERLLRFDPSDNVKVGIAYLAYLSRSFTRPETLLLAYNQGPRGASNIITGRALPSAEAASYTAKVLRVYRALLQVHRCIAAPSPSRYWRTAPLLARR